LTWQSAADGVLLILFGSIGLLGWILNSAANAFGTYPSIAFAAVLPITVLAGTIVSSRMARFIGARCHPSAPRPRGRRRSSGGAARSSAHTSMRSTAWCICAMKAVRCSISSL
jgi:hypothetical protein